MAPYISFYGMQKNSNFRSKSIVLAYDFSKIAILGQKLIEIQYFFIVTPILRINYT
jgi:hypothetical protein